MLLCFVVSCCYVLLLFVLVVCFGMGWFGVCDLFIVLRWCCIVPYRCVFFCCVVTCLFCCCFAFCVLSFAFWLRCCAGCVCVCVVLFACVLCLSFCAVVCGYVCVVRLLLC